MSNNRGLLSTGLKIVTRNSRYIFWFWLLNLTMAEFGNASFRRNAHAVLDHSIYAGGLVRGFDLGVLFELLSRPEFGRTRLLPLLLHPGIGLTKSSSAAAMYFAFLFFALTAMFLPGVFAGYASNYRLRREDFFRACGKNLWPFVRLMFMTALVTGLASLVLFSLLGTLVRQAADSTNELLPPIVRAIGWIVIFLVMTWFRIAFDLAEADIVLNDQRRVRSSMRKGFDHAAGSLGKLLASYVVITIVAGAILLVGLLAWMKFVAPENVWGAFAVAQLTLLLLLVPRFWQRGVAVAYWQREMLAAPNVSPVPAAPLTPANQPTLLG